MSFVRRSAPTALGLAFALASVAAAATPLAAQKISRLGEYSGYSEPIYDSSVRSSQYVTMRDGTKLAVDIIRPTRNGQVHTDPLPVIWTHHRYTRARVRNDTLYTILDWMPYLPRVMSHGYVVAAVDTRGGGASFGTQQGFFGREEAGDAYEITEWLAAQPWSDGNIGMYGRSYLGITQYFAASEAPPLSAAAPPSTVSSRSSRSNAVTASVNAIVTLATDVFRGVGDTGKNTTAGCTVSTVQVSVASAARRLPAVSAMPEPSAVSVNS